MRVLECVRLVAALGSRGARLESRIELHRALITTKSSRRQSSGFSAPRRSQSGDKSHALHNALGQSVHG